MKQKITYQQIKHSFYQSYPDSNDRNIILRIFADSISYISSFEKGDKYWCISCDNDPYYAQLMVGGNVMIILNMHSLSKNKPTLWLSADKEKSNIEQLNNNKNWCWDTEGEYPDYPSINAQNGFYLCSDLEYWNDFIKPLHFASIDKAYHKYKGLRSSSQHKHDPKLVKYINDQLGLNLAQPCYEGKLAASTYYIDNPDDISYSEQSYKEGTVKKITVNRYERDHAARQACVDHYGAVCQVCNIDFHKQYGDIGEGFIHVHHIIPLHTIQEGYEVDPIKDLVPLCPNCHAMIHRIKNTPLSVNELKQRMKGE